METVDKVKKLFMVLVELLMMGLLIYLVAHFGFGKLFGTGVANLINKIVELGVFIMVSSGIVTAILPRTRTHQMLRDTEGDLVKYLMWLLGLQIVALVVGYEMPMIPTQFQQLPNVMIQILITVFSFKAMITPISHIAKMVNMVKSIEIRNPNKAMRRYYR